MTEIPSPHPSLDAKGWGTRDFSRELRGVAHISLRLGNVGSTHPHPPIKTKGKCLVTQRGSITSPPAPKAQQNSSPARERWEMCIQKNPESASADDTRPPEDGSHFCCEQCISTNQPA